MPVQARDGPYPVTSWDFVEALPAEKAARYASPPRWLDDSRFRSRGHASTSWYLHCPYLKSPTPDHLLSADNPHLSGWVRTDKAPLDRAPDVAVREVIVDDTARLHRRVDGRRPDEAEARLLEPLRERRRLGRRGEPVGLRPRDRHASPALYDQKSSCKGTSSRSATVARAFAIAASILPRWRTMPASPSRRRTSRSRKLGDRSGSKPANAARKRLALAQDRQPREARLEPLQAEALVDALLVADRAPPLLVVVGVVGRVGGLPAADDDGGYATSTLTMPSSTKTG